MESRQLLATVADIVDVSPDPRTTAVEQITIQFSDAVIGFDLPDLRLTRDGGSNLLTGSQWLSTGDGGTTWILENLSSLTATPGAYILQLTAAGSGIQDLQESPLETDASDSWVMEALPEVTIAATDASAGESGPDTGQFTITRTGSTANALTVFYSVGGTATSCEEGVDYTGLPNYDPWMGESYVVIPSGSSSTTITITPIDDAAVESDETVILTIANNAGYTRGTPYAATVTITDNDGVNHPPTSVNNTATTNEDTVYTFSTNDFPYSDADSDHFVKVQIVTLATVGVLKLSGVDVTAAAEILAGSIANLTFHPAVDANGTGYASFTFKVHDGTAYSESGYTMTVDVRAVNDAPSFTKGADQQVLEDCGAQTGVGWAMNVSAGPANEAGQALDFAVSNDNNALFAVQPAIAADGTLTYTPAADAYGTATVTVRLYDDGGTRNGGVNASPEQSFTITVSPVNDTPLLTPSAFSVLKDRELTFVAADFTSHFSDADPTDSLQKINIQAVPQFGTLTLSGQPVTTGQEINATDLGDLVYQPAADYLGSDGFQWAGSDGSVYSEPAIVTITVEPLNRAPTLDAISNPDPLMENAGVQTILFSGITAGPGETQALAVTATSSNPDLIPNPTVTYTSPDLSGSLSYTPAANKNGISRITVTVTDAGRDGTLGTEDDATFSRYFTVSVLGVTLSVWEDTAPIANGSTLDFGSGAAGSSMVKTLVLTNTGASALTLDPNSLLLPSGFTLLSEFPESLDAQVSANLTVSLDTTQPGSYGGELSFTNSDFRNSPFHVQLQATVTGGEIGIFDGDTWVTGVGGATGATPTGIVDFDAVFRGTQVTRVLTISNSGNDVLTLSPSTLLLPSGFILVSACPESIPAGESATLTVQMDTSTATTYSGLVSFQTNDFDRQVVMFSLSGKVLGPQIHVYYADNELAGDGSGSVELGKAALGGHAVASLAIANLGTDPLWIDPDSFVLPAGFSIESAPLATVYASGTTRLTIRMATETVGDYGGTFSFVNSDPAHSLFSLTLHGSVTAPAISVLEGSTSIVNGSTSVDFGATPISEPLTKTFTIQNTGTGTLLLDPTLLVAPRGFSMVTPFASSVPQGGSTTFVLRLDASEAGSYSGYISLANNDADGNPFLFLVTGKVTAPAPAIRVRNGSTTLVNEAATTVSGTQVDFGSTQQSHPLSKTFTVENAGAAPLELNPDSLSVPLGFSVATPLASTVVPGATTSVIVQLDATQLGEYAGQITFHSNDPANNTFVFSVTGTVTAGTPAVRVMDGSATVSDGSTTADFGATLVGTAVSKTFTITNTRNATLVLHPETLTVPSGFMVTSPFASSVAPYGTTTLTIEMVAATPGEYQGVVSFTDDDPIFGTVSFAVHGDVDLPPPAISVSDGVTTLVCGASRSFGTTALGTAVSRTFTIQNTGQGTLLLDQNTLVLPSGFSLVTPFASSVAPGASTTLVVQLTAGSSGHWGGQLQFWSNVPNTNGYWLSLNGLVQEAAPTISVYSGRDRLQSGDTVRVPDALVGSSSSIATFQIVNLGTESITLDLNSVVLPAGFSLMSPFVPSLAAGASTSFSVGLSAASAGAYSGAVSFVTGASQDPFSFNISGIVGTELPALDLFCGSRDLTFGQGNVDFGVTVTGMPVTESFTVYNWGGAALALDPDSLILPAGFSLASSFPSLVAAGEFEQFIIQMDAVADGRFFGQISFNTNAFLNPHLVIQVAGTALAPASQLVVLGPEGALASGGILDLGNTLVGACVTKTLAVANAGTAVLSLDPESLSLPAGFSLVGDFPSSVEPGESATFTIQLDAAALGSYSGSLSFTSNDADTSPYTLALTGNTIAPTPILSVRYGSAPLASGAGNVEFPAALSGTPTTVSLTLENQGTAVLWLEPESLSLPPGFSLVTPFAASVAPGGSTTLVIQLDATAAGSYSGTLSFTNGDAQASPFTATLAGTVADAAASIHVLDASRPLDDGIGEVFFHFTTVGVPVERTITIRNTGAGELLLNPASLSLPEGLGVVTPFASSVSSGGSTDLVIRLTAEAMGNYLGQVTFESNDSTHPTFHFSVFGTVVPEAPIATVVSASGDSLLNEAGEESFGVTPSGRPVSRTFTIRNVGSDTLTINVAALTVPAGFSLVSPPAASIAAGGSTDFTVRLDATAMGSYTGEVSFGCSDSFNSAYTFTVSGSVTSAAPTLQVYDRATELQNASAVVDLAATALGVSLTRTFDVSNTGTAALVLDPESLELPAGFSLVAPFASSVAPGASTSFTVQLDATTAGDYSGTVVFTNNDPTRPLFEFRVQGTVLASGPVIQVKDGSILLASGASDDLGTTTPATPLTRTYVIRNVGDQSLSLSSESLSLPAGFSVVTPFGATVAPGDSTTLVVQLNAASLGNYSGALSFATGDPANSTFTLALSAAVVPPAPKLRVNAGGETLSRGGMLRFSPVKKGDAAIRTLTISNTGTAELTLDPASLVVPKGFTVIAPFAASVAPGAATTLVVRMDAAVWCPAPGMLSFATSDPDFARFHLLLFDPTGGGSAQVVMEDYGTAIQTAIDKYVSDATAVHAQLDQDKADALNDYRTQWRNAATSTNSDIAAAELVYDLLILLVELDRTQNESDADDQYQIDSDAAWSTYDSAVATAAANRDTADETVTNTYDSQVSAAETSYNTTVESAWTTFDTSVQGHGATYDGAVAANAATAQATAAAAVATYEGTQAANRAAFDSAEATAAAARDALLASSPGFDFGAVIGTAAFEASLAAATTVFDAAMDGYLAAYHTAVAAAETVYNTSVQTAASAYNAALVSHQTTLDAEIAAHAATASAANQAAQAAYDSAIAGYQATYDATVQSADNTYRAAMTTARNTLNSALETADNAYNSDATAAQNGYNAYQQTRTAQYVSDLAAAKAAFEASVASANQTYASVVNPARDAAGQAIRQAIKDYDTVAGNYQSSFNLQVVAAVEPLAVGLRAARDAYLQAQTAFNTWVGSAEEGGPMISEAQYNQAKKTYALAFNHYIIACAGVWKPLLLSYESGEEGAFATQQTEIADARKTFAETEAGAAKARDDAIAKAGEIYETKRANLQKAYSNELAAHYVPMVMSINSYLHTRYRAYAEAYRAYSDAETAAAQPRDTATANALETLINDCASAGKIRSDALADAAKTQESADAASGQAKADADATSLTTYAYALSAAGVISADACGTAGVTLMTQYAGAAATWIGAYGSALGSGGGAGAWAVYYDTVAVAWVAQVSADALAWQTCNHTLATAGQAEADGNASALESYVDSCVADLVTYMNAAVNAANVLAKAGSAADVTAISGWAANANTYDLAVIATNLPLKQALATAVEAWDKAYADAALDEANAEWPDWLWYTTTVNGKIAAFYTNMAGKRKDYLAAVDAALETAKLDMAPIDHQLAADLARAHQASYNQAMGFSTDEMIQVAQEQLNATSARSPSDFVWLSEPMDIESSAIPITGWYIYIGIHESAQMSLESTAQAYGVSFEGHHWAPNTIAAPAAPPYNGPSFGSMYWHYLTNPSEMDGWVYYANNVAYGMIGIGMGGLAGLGIGAGVGAVGAWAGSSAFAANLAGNLAGGLVGGRVGGAIGGVAGNLGGWIGGIGGGFAGGIAGGYGASSAYSALAKPPPCLAGTVCFVAGTPVLVPGDAEDAKAATAIAAQSDGAKSLDRNWLYAAGAVLVGASLQYDEQRRRKRRQWRREEVIDWCLSEEAREIDDELAASDTASDLDEGRSDDVVADLAMSRSRAAVGLCEQQALSVPKSLATASSIPRAVPDRRSHASRQAAVRPGMRRGRWWLAAWLLLAAVFAGRAYWGATSLPAAPQPRQAAAQGDAPASQPIETIRVGQRVVASVAGNSAAEAAADTQVDPSSWRLLRLRAEDRWADGTLDVVRIETLQGPEWIAAHRATVGATVPLPLDLQEMGLPGSLRAVVTANEPCPPVASGPGRVVLTTVNHLNASVLELTLVDGRGRQERLWPTGSHKFFSEDRQEFVPAEELRQREHLRGAGGRLTLLRAERATGVHRVYNMTVEGEHVYRVSLLGALVHNNCPIWSSTPNKTSVENALGHWQKHGAEFPQFENATQYVQGARNFVNNPSGGTLTKLRPNGDMLFYDPATNTFAVRAVNGAPRTMFKPSGGMKYWNQQ